MKKQSPRKMTFKEKKLLSVGINKLNSNNLGKMVELIDQEQPGAFIRYNSHIERVVECDINALNNATLCKLFEFVESCRPRRSFRLRKPKVEPRSS